MKSFAKILLLQVLGYQFGHISEWILLLWGERGGLWALAAQLRAGGAAPPLAEHRWTPQASETPKAWAGTEWRWMVLPEEQPGRCQWSERDSPDLNLLGI